jgi:hypothetical protein
VPDAPKLEPRVPAPPARQEPSQSPANRGAFASLERHFEQLAERWEDPTAHAAFLEACTRADALPFAALAYRRATSDPARSAVAEEQLALIAARAFEALELRRARARAEPGVGLGWLRAGLWVLVAIVVLGAAGLHLLR